ncbi:MAG: hypothetical protein ABJP45_03435 [Cyclobacteriaceae bacterium]
MNKLSPILVATLLFKIQANAQILDPQKFIDNKYDYNIEWDKTIEIGGALIHEYWNKTADRFTIVQRRHNEFSIMIFNKILGEPDELEMLDILVTTQGQGEFISYQLCQSNKKMDQEIVALVKMEDKKYYDNIKSAWRANRKTGEFEEISVDSIRCRNEGFGI